MTLQNPDRRKLLAGFAIGAIGLSLPWQQKISYWVENSDGVDLLEAVSIWSKNYTVSPQDYLQDIAITGDTYKFVQREEFRMNNFISFNGLYIAKSELAVLAILGGLL